MPHRVLGVELVPGALAAAHGPIRHWTADMPGAVLPMAFAAGQGA